MTDGDTTVQIRAECLRALRDFAYAHCTEYGSPGLLDRIEEADDVLGDSAGDSKHAYLDMEFWNQDKVTDHYDR